MNRFDKTTMGGNNEAFHTTRWSDIHDAQKLEGAKKQEIINKLLMKYWKPVYCYLRRKGYDNENAKDFTQGFFHEVILGKHLIQQSDETKGKFRTFLLTTLDRYITDIHRYESAKKRAPGGGIVKLETTELSNLSITNEEVGPDQAFHFAWVADLLNQVMATVKNEYYNTGKKIYWKVFYAKVLLPIFDNVEAPPLTEICKKYGVDTESRASNMILSIKRRFRSVLKHHLRQLVQSDSEADEEFSELFKILSKGSTI